MSETKISDQELIKEIKRLYKSKGRTPTFEIMRKEGQYSPHLCQRRFGSWNNAIEASGLGVNERKGTTETDIIKEIKRISEHFCSGETPTKRDMTEYGKISNETIIRVFGGWNKALSKAGYDVNIHQHKDIERSELLDEIKAVYRKKEIDETPKKKDMDELGRFSYSPYVDKFDSWNNAVKEAGFEPNPQHASGKEHPFWAGGENKYYGSSWRKQRQKALKRDEYSCVICGEEKEEKQRNVHVHHIVPRRLWNVYDEHETMNSLDNLVSLCAAHHRKFEFKNQKYTYEEFVQEFANG